MFKPVKIVGRFSLHSFLPSGGHEIHQTHANGSAEVIAEFIQLDRDSLLDLQYIVNRALSMTSE